PRMPRQKCRDLLSPKNPDLLRTGQPNRLPIEPRFHQGCRSAKIAARHPSSRRLPACRGNRVKNGRFWANVEYGIRFASVERWIFHGRRDGQGHSRYRILAIIIRLDQHLSLVVAKKAGVESHGPRLALALEQREVI